MLEYHPLDLARNEVRVLSFDRPTVGKPINCTLEHVSLDSYSTEYSQFLERIGDSVPKQQRDYLWNTFTSVSVTKQQIENITQYGMLKPLPPLIKRLDPIDRYRSHLLKSAFGREKFRNARRYTWGDFCALSYEWGDTSLRRDIIVNGVETTVTKNLDDALRGIGAWWHSVHGEGDMRIWIDAICINQNNLEERSIEVRRMGTIYSDALVVLSWLGPELESPYQQEVPDLIRHFLADIMHNGALLEDAAKSQMTPERIPAWKGMLLLAARSYWHRLWIVQEVVLANTASLICIGNEYFLTALFLRLLQSLSQAQGYLPTVVGSSKDSLEYDQSFDLLIHMEVFLGLEVYKHKKLPHPPLLLVIDISRQCKQSDPRDKVYGILGLIDTRIKDAIVLDYNKPVLDVFMDFATAIIKSTGRLEILLQGASDHLRMRQKVLPSWCLCPTLYWSSFQEKLNVHTLGRWQAEHYSHFGAAGNTRHIFRHTTNSTHLLCQGFLLDVIDGLGCYHYADMPHDEHNSVARGSSCGPLPTPAGTTNTGTGEPCPMKMYAPRQRHPKNHRFPKTNSIPSSEVTIGTFWSRRLASGHRSKERIRNRDESRLILWDTLTVGFQFSYPTWARELQKSAEKYLDSIPWLREEAEQADYFRVIRRFQQCNADMVVGGMPLRELFPPDDGSFALNPWPFQKALGSAMAGMSQRRYVTTTSGRQGLGPKAARRGDKIVILHGCNLPLIIRPKLDGTFTVLGECYVHGVMDGEAMDVDPSCLMDIVLS